MKNLKNIFAPLLGSLLVAASLQAEEAKMSLVQRVLPEAKGSAEFRVKTTTDKAEFVNKPQGLLTVESKMLDGNLEGKVTFGVEKKAKTNAINDRGTQLSFKYSRFATANDEGFNASFTPFTKFKLPNNEFGLNGKAGFGTEVSYTMDAGFGPMKAFLGGEFAGVYGSRQSVVQFTKDGDKTVTTVLGPEVSTLEQAAAGTKEGTFVSAGFQEYNTVKGYATAGLAYESTALRGFSIEAQDLIKNTWTPSMSLNKDNKVETKMDKNVSFMPSYEKNVENWVRVKAQYEISNYYVSNETLVAVGHEGAVKDGQRQVANYASVGAYLF